MAENTLKEGPRVLDERLELSLFAENPDIVTPIGIVIDSLDRIFVLESHTHLPPKDYKGPKGDIIKIFTDENKDGKPDKTTLFAEGLKEGLNLSISPQGHLYVVTSREVWRLLDQNKDGVSEIKEKVVVLVEPEKVYAHSALLGITFSPDGWMYISRGNTGSATWKMVGTDSSSVGGYGDGGNIVRARLDGTKLEEVATGFWNPIDLKFDRSGRLMAVDNDPDSRGPNRLVHVVPGGDYGYQSLYGASGIHPYLSWNGELPGTLPYAVGVGEAPSGLMDARLASLPADYKGQMLATIWEESRIVRINFKPKGVSVTGTTEVIVEGDQDFRPVAFATDTKGNIYFTDWVLRDYPNHGKGRIWKLSAKSNIDVTKPGKLYAAFSPDGEGKKLQEIYTASSSSDFERLKEALQSPDPFLTHAAVMALTQPSYQQQLVEATRNREPNVRLGAAIALQRSGYREAEPVLRQLLADPDERVRQRALIWIGKQGITALRPDIDKALIGENVSRALFETYLETISHLDPEFIEAYNSRTEGYSKAIKRGLPAKFLETFISNTDLPAGLRALAIPHLDSPGNHLQMLTQLLVKEKNPEFRQEIVRTLANLPGENVVEHLLKVAWQKTNPASLRAEAILGLTRQPKDVSTRILPLLEDQETDIQIEVARYLRTKVSNEEVKTTLQEKYSSLQTKEDNPLGEQLAMALSSVETGSTPSKRPSSIEEWQKALEKGGNPARGHRVLYSLQSMCSVCHAVAGRGGDLGPALTNSGQSKTRAQLVHSILRPSEEISPEYQGWYIKLKNGEIHQGRQIDIGGSSIELYTPSVGFITFDKKDIEDYGISNKSLMPDGLEKQLTVSDLRDLISFLESNTTTQPDSRISLQSVK